MIGSRVSVSTVRASWLEFQERAATEEVHCSSFFIVDQVGVTAIRYSLVDSRVGVAPGGIHWLRCPWAWLQPPIFDMAMSVARGTSYSSNLRNSFEFCNFIRNSQIH